MMPHLRGLFLLLLLGAGSTALALRIWDDLQRSPEMPAIVEPDAAPSDQVIEVPEMPKYDPPPIERFAAALDRPLFRPDRRPPAEVAVAAGTVEGGALSATLRGILFSNLEGVALLSPIGEFACISLARSCPKGQPFARKGAAGSTRLCSGTIGSTFARAA